MYNKSISKSRFSKVLPNFADELLMASLQISVYWSSGSDVICFMSFATIKLLIISHLAKFYWLY